MPYDCNVEAFLTPIPGCEVKIMTQGSDEEAAVCCASILLVEDDELVRESISNKLARFGYLVTTAKNAEDAMALLETMPVLDLVFSDVVMPGMSGADFARTIHKRWPSVGVVLTSGYAETALEKVSIPEGMKLLPKPYSNDALQQFVRAALRVIRN